MPQAYYKGVALDYKAQNYDDDYSLREYCQKYHKERCSSCCTDTTFVEGDTVKTGEPSSVWCCLKYVFPFAW